MTWAHRSGVLVWEGDPAALDNAAANDESAYRWTAVPVDERQRPKSCGRPGTGRSQHRKHGEPVCAVCAAAEAAYTAWRRDIGRLA